MSSGRFEGKVVLVTGAARGQGRNHAIRFAQEGADIIALDVCDAIDTVGYDLATPEDLHATVEAVEALDRRIVATVADVRDLAAVTAAVDDGVARLGRVDVVCANAGIATYCAMVDMDENTWRTMIDVNLTGQFFTAHAAVPHMIRQGDGGSVIFTSSVCGLVGTPNLPHYSAAKHGLVGLARSMANELGEHRIRVNTVHPTNVDTPMVQSVPSREVYSATGMSDAEYAEVAATINLLPIPWVDVDDISEAMLYLASDAGRYVTGIALPVDAGASQKV